MKCPGCGLAGINPSLHECKTGPSPYSIRARRDRSPGWKIGALSLAAAAVAALGLYWLASERAKSKMVARGWDSDRTVTIGPGGREQWTRFTEERGTFRFAVRAHDGRVTMADGKAGSENRAGADRSAVDAAIKNGWWVDPETPRTWSGRLEPGLHVWVVENPSKDKPVTVTIDFFAEGR